MFLGKTLCGHLQTTSNLSLGNGIIRKCAVSIHVSEFHPEKEILARIKS